MSVLVIVFLFGVLALFSGFCHRGKWAGYIGVIGILVALIVSFLPEISFWGEYYRMFLYDAEVALFTRITLVITLLIFLLGNLGLYGHRNHQSEIYALVMFSLCGGLIMLGFQNFTTLFLGIEILSIPLYVLAGSEKTNHLSVEASVKYFLLGAFATGFLLFGFALIYGSSGSLDINKVAIFSQNKGQDTIFILGVLMVLIALAFKVAMVPFHLWLPDVYQGSSSWITLFMASVVKMVVFYALFKLMNIAFVGVKEDWLAIWWGLVVITLLLTSVLGMVQQDVKRILAYSSIVNSGYIGLIFFGVDDVSNWRLAFYLLAYSLATLGIFMGLIWVERDKKNTSYIAFNGLAKKQPVLALLVAVSVFSMVGVPFTAGFMGKLNLLSQAIKETEVLVLISVLASVISIAYYLRLIIAMYFKNDDDLFGEKLNIKYKFLAMFIIVITIALGIFPEFFKISFY